MQTFRAPPSQAQLTELKNLILAQWAEVYRAGRHVAHHGALLVDNFSGAIIHELSLTYRDFPVLVHLLTSCENESGEVDLAKLRETVSTGATKKTIPDDEKERFGVKFPKSMMNTSPQRLMSAGAHRKYLIENHGPPYAVAGDTDFMMDYQRNKMDVKHEQIHHAMVDAADGNGKIKSSKFHAAITRLDHNGVSEKEAKEILRCLDPHKTGVVDVEEFCSRFSKEYLKPKSLRNTLGVTNNDGRTNALEWLSSLTDNPLREARSPRHPSTPRARKHRFNAPSSARSTRASDLRKSTGDHQRQYLDQSPERLKDWLVRSQSLASKKEASNNQQVSLPAMPKPPQNRFAHSARFRKPIVADGVSLGNLKRSA